MQFPTPALRLTFIHAESYRFPATWVFGPARLPYSMLRLVTDGSGEFIVDGAEHEVREGDVVHLPEGSVLECRSTSKTLTFTSLRFSCPVLVGGQDPLSDLYAFTTIMRPDRLAEAAGHFEALADPALAEAPGRHFLALGHLHLIIGMLAGAGPEAARNSDGPAPSELGGAPLGDPRVLAVVDLLLGHVGVRPSVAQLCQTARMSESALRKLFKQHTGKSIGTFYREHQLTAAARRLLTTDDRVGEVAKATGFSDANYFARAFHQTFGLSPSAYRSLARTG